MTRTSHVLAAATAAVLILSTTRAEAVRPTATIVPNFFGVGFDVTTERMAMDGHDSPDDTSAEAAQSERTAAASGTTGSWRPPAPEADEFDWIQLKSGEWLKGSLKSMQDYSLEFDSEELDWQTFDWKDIRQVRSPHLHEVLLDGRQEDGEHLLGRIEFPPFIELLSDERIRVEGAIHVSEDNVTVETKEGPMVFDRARLIAITPAGSHEIDFWSGKITIGLTTLTGNTDSKGLNTTADLTRRTPVTRLALDYLGTMGELDGVESANNHRVTAHFDYWLSRRIYVRAPALEYFSDPFSNVAHRVTGTIGLGYDIIHQQNLEWEISMGPGYQSTEFDTVETGKSDSVDTMVFAIGTSAEATITKRVDLNLTYAGQFVSQQAGGQLHHTVATVEIDLTKILELDLSVVWDHVSHPQAAVDGSVPKQNDVRSSLSLGVKL